MLTLTDPVTDVPLIGERMAEHLARLNIETVEDLLTHYPTRYVDASKIHPITDLTADEPRTIKVMVDEIKDIRRRGGKSLTTAKVSDTTGQLGVIWFNQKYITKTVQKGAEIYLFGKIKLNRNKPQLYAPEYEVVKEGPPTHLAKIVPFYSLTDKISQKWLRAKITYLLQNAPFLLDEITSPIPKKIERRYNLIPKANATRIVHDPQNFEELEQARYSLMFEELFTLQHMLYKKRKALEKLKGVPIHFNTHRHKNLIKSLPFKQTSAQQRCIKEITSDLKKKHPMNRLLEGDVGAGKTLVAAAAALQVIHTGFQVAFLAPTTVLARQHYESLKKLLPEVNIALFTSSDSITTRDDALIIGTQALLFGTDQKFSNLALIIVDEQHRFGVKQREELLKLRIHVDDGLTKSVPHLLMMTATPIPRSMALTFFGDLDVSLLDELPAKRIPTETHIVPEPKRKDSYDWIKEKISHGNSVFWICPIIEESETLQVKNVTDVFKHLRKAFAPIPLDLLHGRIKPKEKTRILEEFADRKTKILVSTSVVEVGIDIPDANIIVIEGAERFGLAQLHQLRGRVGRREKPSWCFLFPTHNSGSQSSAKRLEFFTTNNNGIELAEFDLHQRGPGEIYGTMQAGIPNLKIASITDHELIKQTREAVEIAFSERRNLD